MDARSANKLTTVERGGDTFEVEDAENGNGLCYMTSNNSIYLSYRNDWKTYNEPTKIIQTETNNVIFSMMYGNNNYDVGCIMHKNADFTICCLNGNDSIRDKSY